MPIKKNTFLLYMHYLVLIYNIFVLIVLLYNYFSRISFSIALNSLRIYTSINYKYITEAYNHPIYNNERKLNLLIIKWKS